MLEAIRNRSKGWIAKVILGLLIIPFALWGVDSYFSGTGEEAPAARIGDHEISQRDFAQALQEQQEELGIRSDDSAMRERVLDQLINTRLLSTSAREIGFTILEPQIHAVLFGVEIFQENGQFSEARMDNWLRSRDMGRGELLNMIGEDLLLRQVQIGLGEGAVVARPVAQRLAGLLNQQREVSELRFDSKDHAQGIKIEDAELQAYYQARQADFATPAQVRLEYLSFSLSDLATAVRVSPEQVRQFYEANLTRYQEPELRRASHILIRVDADASAEARTAAKARADALLLEVRAAPGKFAELARMHSQDPGSAANGGDLGAFGREMMVKPFADMVWSLQPGEIGEVLETQFGYHIIRLESVVPGAKMSFEVVRDDIERELTETEAQRRFIDAAERFSNLVYEQPDSLAPAATEFELKIQQSGWLGQGQTDIEPAFLAHPRMLAAVFSESAVVRRENTEALEVAPNHLLAARVIEHRPPGVRPLADVAGDIRAILTTQAARKLAVAAGEKALAGARAGQVPGGLSAAMTVSRIQPRGLSTQALRVIFQADGGKLPAYAGVETEEGYRLYRISRVFAEQVPDGLVETIGNDLRHLTMNEEMRAYLASLKAKTRIKITPGTLDARNE